MTRRQHEDQFWDSLASAALVVAALIMLGSLATKVPWRAIIAAAYERQERQAAWRAPELHYPKDWPGAPGWLRYEEDNQ